MKNVVMFLLDGVEIHFGLNIFLEFVQGIDCDDHPIEMRFVLV